MREEAAVRPQKSEIIIPATARKTNLAPYLFTAPYLILVIAFSIYPILHTFYISFHKWNGIQEMEFIGLQNYIRMIRDGSLLLTLKNTLIILAILLPIQLCLGLLLAYAASSRLCRYKNIFRTAIFTPYLTIPVAAGLMWGFVLDRKIGILNHVLMNLGLINENISWIGDPILTRFVIAAVMLWRYLGYTMVMYMAGLIAIPEEVYESARIDGAKAWQILLRISIPMIKPISAYLIITSLIGGFQTYDEPTMLYANSASESFQVGGPEKAGLLMVMNLVNYTSKLGQFGYGAAISYALFIVIMVFSGVTGFILRRGEENG